MTVKKPSKLQVNHIRTYLTDEEYIGLMRRMNEEIIDSISAYVRRLIIMDQMHGKK